LDFGTRLAITKQPTNAYFILTKTNFVIMTHSASKMLYTIGILLSACFFNGLSAQVMPNIEAEIKLRQKESANTNQPKTNPAPNPSAPANTKEPSKGRREHEHKEKDGRKHEHKDHPHKDGRKHEHKDHPHKDKHPSHNGKGHKKGHK
jgi:hypothetical protein